MSHLARGCEGSVCWEAGETTACLLGPCVICVRSYFVEMSGTMSGGIFIWNGDQSLQLYNSFGGRAHIGGDLFTKVLVLKQPILVLWCFEILNLTLLQFVTGSGCKQKAVPRIRKDWSDLWKEVKTLSTWLARQVVSGASADIPSIQFLGQCQPTVQRNTSVYTEKYTGLQ